MTREEAELHEWLLQQVEGPRAPFDWGGQKMPHRPLTVAEVRQAMDRGLLDQLNPMGGGRPPGPAKGSPRDAGQMRVQHTTAHALTKKLRNEG